METLILAADAGGTHTRLALAIVEGCSVQILRREVRPTCAEDPPAIFLERFLAQDKDNVSSGSLAIAGPVRGNRGWGPQLPWEVDGLHLADRLGLAYFSLLNDLEAIAWGVLALDAGDTVTINEGVPSPEGNIGVIAAGTGLGQSVLVRKPGGGYVGLATEGGHAEFAPQTDQQICLLRWLKRQYGHVSVERVLSGPGLVKIHAWLCEQDSDNGPASAEWVKSEEDAGAAISKAALEGRDELCLRALDLFVTIYGAEAGNLALRSTATAGIYLGGGIAPSILPAFTGGRLLDTFCDKGRFSEWMRAIPLSVITSPDISLKGAAIRGAALLEKSPSGG